MDLIPLPMFEGAEPRTTQLSLTGKSDRRTRPYHIGDEVVLVVEGIVRKVTHEETKGGLQRAHSVEITSAYELGGDRAPTLVEELSVAYREQMDGLEGKSALPFDGSTDDPPQVGEIRSIDGVDHEWVEDGDDDEGVGHWMPIEPDDSEG